MVLGGVHLPQAHSHQNTASSLQPGCGGSQCSGVLQTKLARRTSETALSWPPLVPGSSARNRQDTTPHVQNRANHRRVLWL